MLDRYIHGISVDEQKGVVIATDVNKDELIIEYRCCDTLSEKKKYKPVPAVTTA